MSAAAALRTGIHGAVRLIAASRHTTTRRPGKGGAGAGHDGEPVDEVKRTRQGSEVIPVSDRDEEFEALLEQSSLGSPGGRLLRRRTPRAQVDTVRRIAEFLDLVARGTEHQRKHAEADLVSLLRDLGYHTQLAAISATLPGPVRCRP